MATVFQNIGHTHNTYIFVSQDPSFHISIAWCVGDRKEELEKLLTDYTTSYLDYPGCYLNELVCKVGHLRFACPLTL